MGARGGVSNRCVRRGEDRVDIVGRGEIAVPWTGMTVLFLSPANRELPEAVDRYDAERIGLGYEFLAEVETAREDS